MSQDTQQINYRQVGKGNPILLIHGFPMSGEIWEDEFVNSLASEFNVFMVDLPGFGKSPLAPEQFTIDTIATKLIDWLNFKGIEKIVVIGHSLGGYVALAMVAQSPEKFNGLGLLHSTALADSEEKKESRDKTIELIKKSGASAFTTNFIPQLFVDKKHPGIAKVKKIASQATAETVIGYTQAMRDRTERTAVIKSYLGPVLFIAGDKDPGIPVDTIHSQAALAKRPIVHVLDNQAHMAMMESPTNVAEKIKNFVKMACKTI